MAKDNTVLYVALGLGALYLLKRKQAAVAPVVPQPVQNAVPVSQVSQVGLLLPILQKFIPSLLHPSSSPVTSDSFSTPGTAENISDTSEANFWQSQVPAANSSSPSASSGDLVTNASSSPTGLPLGEDDESAYYINQYS